MTTGSGAAEHADVLDRPIDWERAERSPEFRELIASRRRFVVPATSFFLAWYLAFVLLAGYAPGFMRESVYQGLTVGYCLALTQFVMVFVLGVWYLRKSERTFDPLAARAAQQALQTAEAAEGDGPAQPAGSATAGAGGRRADATSTPSAPEERS